MLPKFLPDILKPVWFLAFQKTKAWLPARHVVQAGSYPRTEKRRGLSPDKKRRGLYSGKIVFGFYPRTEKRRGPCPKTILR
jgi:hypothetical protein